MQFSLAEFKSTAIYNHAATLQLKKSCSMIEYYHTCHCFHYRKFSSDNTGHKNVNYLKNPIVSFIWQTFVMLLPESLFQHLLSLNTVIILSQAKFGLAALFKRTAAAEQFLVE